MLTEILLVDDEDGFRKSTAKSLRNEGYIVHEASNRLEGQDGWTENQAIQVVLVDLKMPESDGQIEVSGHRLIRWIREKCGLLGRRVAISALTASRDHAALSAAVESGADAYIYKNWATDAFLKTVRFCEKWNAAGSGISVLRRSLEMRDPYTAGHCQRVMDLVRGILVQLEDADAENFDLGSCLAAAAAHDVGKLAVPDDVLMGSRSDLTIEERDALIEHVFIGSRAVAELGSEFERAAEILLLHHRWYDNKGRMPPSDYPESDANGKPSPRGQGIPFESRVLAVADTLDAMLSDRSYRPGLPLDVAKNELRRGRGSQFCPLVTEAALAVSDDVYQGISELGRIRDVAQLVLWFGDKRLTPGRLLALFETLRFIYLPNGAAIGRLAVRRIQALPGNPAEVVLQGEAEEIRKTFSLLRKRMEYQARKRDLAKSAAAKGEAAADYLMEGAFAVPLSIQMTLPNEPPVFYKVS